HELGRPQAHADVAAFLDPVQDLRALVALRDPAIIPWRLPEEAILIARVPFLDRDQLPEPHRENQLELILVDDSGGVVGCGALGSHGAGDSVRVTGAVVTTPRRRSVGGLPRTTKARMG